MEIQDYSLINTEILKEKLEYYQELNSKEPLNSYIEGKMDLLKELIDNHLIPSDKLASICFSEGVGEGLQRAMNIIQQKTTQNIITPKIELE